MDPKTSLINTDTLDPKTLKANLFEVEWRPQLFPEVYCAELFAQPEAREKILAGQLLFLNRLEPALKSP
jgi:predicted NUDIX family NTP pyrophosphohydrolase